MGHGGGDEIADSFRAISLVRQDKCSFKRHIEDRCFRFSGIMEVAGSQVDVYRVSEAVDNRENFRCFAASADTDILVYLMACRPFFAPVLCW
jgi:hypothetical protein